MLLISTSIVATAAFLGLLSKLGMVIVAAISGRRIDIAPDKITLWPK